MKHYLTLFFALLLAPLAAPLAMTGMQAEAAEPASPGTPDWAADTAGGRGGQILRVTTLTATGPGSLTEAVQAKGRRIVVFEVGGIIDLGGKSLNISEPFLTIAGQTAPAPGITLIRGQLSCKKVHDVIIQQVRVRAGEAGHAKKSGYEVHGIDLSGAWNIIVDHCSLSWGTDENLSASGPRFEGATPDEWRSNTAHRVTFSNCILAEGLGNSTHGKGEHSKGTLIHDNATGILIVGNLYASNRDRNPLAKAGVHAVIVNNWITNPGRAAIHHGAVASEWTPHEFIPSKLVVVGNVMEAGPDSSPKLALFSNSQRSPLELFMADNLAFKYDGHEAPLTSGEFTKLEARPFWPAGLVALPAAQVKEHVLKNAGARPWNRDDVDHRIVQAAIERKGKIIDSEQDVGGYPTATPTKEPFNPADWNLDTLQPRVLKAAETNEVSDKADLDQLVAQTHKASLKLREEALRKTIAKDTCWPQGIWGDNLWTLSALSLNEKVDEANARLLKQANDFIDMTRKLGSTPAPTPEQPGNAPWTFFSITDYVRTLCLFHSKSPHFPGRLKPETEAAMKEALWLWVSKESRIADAGLDHLFLLLGTENHDLNKRPNYYLITALLQEDPAYRDRKLADGHTVAEHANAHTTFLREWPRRRAQTGLWTEVGSNTYQKYSWPALFNLHELAPDPVIRKRFGLLLDLAFIEEEQISVRGRRGGGRSRAYPAANAFESYKNLLFASEGQPAGSSHSRVIETSRYQLPPEAILLRKRTFPSAEPFVIRNRVLGELDTAKPGDEVGQRLAADSALVNYAYRTPHYLLGSTLQNPALTMPDPKTGEPTLKYSGISRQNRACGMLFDDPASDEICAVYPEIGHGGGGRPQHSFWSVQHENILILQRIAPLGRTSVGSYHTDAISIGFEGKALKKMEEGGWIFASNGKAFVGVKFLDGGYVWDEKRTTATPANFDTATDKSRILLHAGDIASHGSFDKFKADVLANHLSVTPDKVDYQFGPAASRLEIAPYDAKALDRFSLPLINGKPVDLRPAKTYQSPYLNGDFGSDSISVSVGPIKRIIDFSK